MIDSGTLVLVGVLALWLLGIALLYRRFERRGAEPPYALLAAAALVVGVTFAVLGALHAISVAPIPALNDEPYDTRRVWLLTIGLILVHTGVVNAFLYRPIRRAERGALVTATTVTTLLFAFLLVLHPARDQTVFLFMSGGYLALLFWRLRPVAGGASTSEASARA